MEKYLRTLSFNEKEIQVYLALLEYGTQPASVLARKVHIPKSTVLFLLDGLCDRGYVRKSQRKNTQYFHADPSDLARAKKQQIEEEEKALADVLPLLEEFQTPFSSMPKVSFFEGIQGCKKAYLLLLESTTDIIEFAAHEDLVNTFGEDFMEDFIRKRVKRNIGLEAICQDSAAGKAMQKRAQAEQRSIKLFPEEKGRIYSSIAVFENKVLLLNLFQDAFGILIENQAMAETMRTMYRLM